MIIFDLDGTLADCEHRKHFVDPKKRSPNGLFMNENKYENGEPTDIFFIRDEETFETTNKIWKPDWKSFYEACSEDKPIIPTIHIFHSLYFASPRGKYFFDNVQIWSGRCESVRKKTLRWLNKHIFSVQMLDRVTLKMRPIGDYTPDDQLKERWLNERCADYMSSKIQNKIPIRHDIEYVFDHSEKCCEMWRRHGIFVFNCFQHEEEF